MLGTLSSNRLEVNSSKEFHRVLTSVSVVQREVKSFEKMSTSGFRNSEYDQEIPQSQTADNPVAPRGRAAQPSGLQYLHASIGVSSVVVLASQ